MASLDSLQQILDTAKSEFERDLPLNTPLRDILAITSVDKVWAEVEKLQYEQERKSNLRHANRIKLFLDRLRSYAAVIEVFIQVKPDVLALLWGPIKLLLMWTAEWQQALDAIIRTIERIGDRLPSFGEVRKHFIDKERTKDVLGLFYRDILDFYLEVLTFFSRPRKLAQALTPVYATLLLLTLKRPQADVRCALAKA